MEEEVVAKEDKRREKEGGIQRKVRGHGEGEGRGSRAA